MGAIWAASAGVNGSRKINTALTEIMTISQGVHALYAQQSTTGDSDGTYETTNLISAGVFPSSMIASSNVFNPWGTSAVNSVNVTSQSISIANTGDAIAIEFQNIPTAGCVGILLGAAQDTSLVHASATTLSAPLNNSTLATPFILNTTSNAANNVCSISSRVNVQLAFKLRG